MTALHSSHKLNNNDSVEALIEAGARVNAKDKVTQLGRQYIVTGTMTFSRDSVEALIEEGARVNDKDKVT